MFFFLKTVRIYSLKNQIVAGGYGSSGRAPAYPNTTKKKKKKKLKKQPQQYFANTKHPLRYYLKVQTIRSPGKCLILVGLA
jgi:hypothetical protein